MMLSDQATVIRSKKAGPFDLTFDVLFANQNHYRKVVAPKHFSAESSAELYTIDLANVLSVVGFEPSLAVKITEKCA